MELQACEKADQIHPFIKSFGNHNTTIATSATAELVKYNIWYKKFLNKEDKLSKKFDINLTGLDNALNDISHLNSTDDPQLKFWSIQKELLTGECYLKDNPQYLSIIETALCYGLCLDYDAITARKKEVDAVRFASDVYSTDANKIKKDYLKDLYKLRLICRYKILDTAMFSLFETDVLTDDRLSLFGVNNTTDHLAELLALEECPSDEFDSILQAVANMARDNEAPVFKIIEQFTFLPHTLENDLLTNASKSKREELEQKITEIREKYAQNSQNVTDATVFRTASDDDEETYDFEASQATSVDKMNMYG